MQILIVLLIALLLTGCGSFGRLATVGKAPKMTQPEVSPAPVLQGSLGRQGPTDRAGTDQQLALTATPSASLFRTGAGAFFRDQRAGRVGDILTVRINIADRADCRKFYVT